MRRRRSIAELGTRVNDLSAKSFQVSAAPERRTIPVEIKPLLEKHGLSAAAEQQGGQLTVEQIDKALEGLPREQRIAQKLMLHGAGLIKQCAPLGIEALTQPQINWTRLRFMNYGPLDYWPREYDPNWLRESARRLQAGEELGSMAYFLGQCLLDLVENNSALQALNDHSDRSAEFRALNMAVHYAAEKEHLGKALAARVHVANTWGAQEGTVKRYYTEYKTRAQALIDDIVNSCATRPEDQRTDRPQTLALLCADMVERSRISWLREVSPREGIKTRSISSP